MSDKVPMEEMRIALGAHNIKERPPVVMPVVEIIKHENYGGKDDGYKWDITLLKLAEPVEFNDVISPVCLAPDTLQSFSNLMAVGWGKTGYEGPTSDVLLEAAVTEVLIPQCQRKYGTKRVTPTHVCTQDAGKSVCMGDSGGPLLTQQNGVWYDIGIVSWGIKCGQGQGANYPAVFTRVSSYLQWVYDRTGDANWCRRPQPEPVASAQGSSRNGMFGRFFG